MKLAILQTSQARWNLAQTITALAIAAIIAGTWILPVQAQSRGRDRGHEVSRYHHGRDWHGGGYYAAPAYVYAPPPVYYAPVAPPPGISFVFPLRFR
jgi:hypothetical protein